MYQLLKDYRSLPHHGELVLPEFRRIRDGLLANYKRVLQYHFDNPRAVPNGHLLIRLLMSLNVSITLEPEIYNDKVRDVALYVAKALKMTTVLSEGQAFTPGVFYGQHVTEIIWGHIDDYDTSQLRDNWRSLQPVRVLYHPKTDLAFEVPNGKHSSEEAGMAAIAVNIPMLASQYRMWRLEQIRLNVDSQRSIAQFLMELPLPQMLPSHVDIALMNRLIGTFFGIELPVIPPHHTFYITDWCKDIDRMNKQLLRFMAGKPFTFDAIVSMMPVAFAEDLHEHLTLPDLSFVRQVQWAAVVSRLALVTFLVQFTDTTNNQANRQYLNYLRRYLLQMDIGRMLEAGLTRKRYEEVRLLIERGIEPYL